MYITTIEPALFFLKLPLFLFGLNIMKNDEFYFLFFLCYSIARSKTQTQDQEEITMVIEKNAMAGTLESSDAQVTVEPGETLDLDISSSVLNQYGRQIRETVLETLDRLDVKAGRVTVIDKGALDCTLKARVECAVFRSCGASEKNLPWGGAIHA